MPEIGKQEAKGRKRNVQINIRISEAEAEQLRKKVEQSGMSQRGTCKHKSRCGAESNSHVPEPKERA